MCGKEQSALYHHIRNHDVTCECFRNRSSGETIVDQILTKNNIPHESEYTFEDLFGEGGGSLRYDFAILNNDKIIFFMLPPYIVIIKLLFIDYLYLY